MSISNPRRNIALAGLATTAATGALVFALLGSGPTVTAAPAQQIAVELTAYQGKQPDGFSIKEVPTGWDVLAADAGKLVLAPKDAGNRNPNEFEGKILVTVANEAELSVTRDNAHDLKVDDVTATRFTFSGGGSAGLLLPAKDRTLIFQLPESLDWDDAAIAEFAAGVQSIGTPEIAAG